MSEHAFTKVITRILQEEFGDRSETIFKASELLQYLNIKTRSASRGSKSRGSFGNHYAIYVLVEDYIAKGYTASSDYGKYEGARFSDLHRRQRELPFGSKLQNHALNHRLNQEFKKYFPTCEYIPILRDAKSNRYWLHESLLKIDTVDSVANIAEAVIRIVDAYVKAKQGAFEDFIAACERMQGLKDERVDEVRDFIAGLLEPNIDARVFEIVSFAILKSFYSGQVLFWGWAPDELQEDPLILYKTGRTNANDGGIDFVMQPLGRFFQVTETMDVRKYFLDIDKVQRFPITFVIKVEEGEDIIREKLRIHAKEAYGIEAIVDRYMECVEEIINIPILMERFEDSAREGRIGEVIDEVVLQSKVEFHYEEH